MHDDRTIVEKRVVRLLGRLRSAVVTARSPCAVGAWDAPGRNVAPGLARSAPYAPIEPGTPWGTAWQTTWFAVEGEVPSAWAGGRVELEVDLGFLPDAVGFQAEALVYDADGAIIKGLAPRTAWLPVAVKAEGTESVRYYLEAAANPRVAPEQPDLGAPEETGPRPRAIYRFGGADLVLIDEEVRTLVADIEVLDGVMRELSTESPRRHEILRALERALDELDPLEVAAGAGRARAELRAALQRPSVPSAHALSAVGHAHIDSAWLWPLEETERKCLRTFANVLALMEEYPELLFACSQAQQYAWVKALRPELYERIRAQVAAGRWLPVGGMWVESDTNLTGGEGLARQLLYGKRFFLEEFGVECEEVWLPDCFGYSGALPQLIALAGCRFFLTQKLSWNQTNRFPHHSFLWEGIDGTRIFTHFPPVETYNAQLTPAELAHAERTFADHGHATRSLVPFGYGDGGGGPTREMLERARRLADLEGMPRLTIEGPATFFAQAEAELADPAVWTGEIYLELHRGTYTSQAGIKRGNRRCEHLLREAELWSASAAQAGRLDYPYAELERLWKLVCLHHFHDILPGSSIAAVNEEAVAAYGEIAEALEQLIAGALAALCGEGALELAANAAPHPRLGVPALGVGPVAPEKGAPVESHGGPRGGYVLDNGLLRAEVDDHGLLVSLFDHLAERELIAPGAAANLLQLHPDLPNAWDAWDVDAFYRHRAVDLTEVDGEIRLVAGPDEAVVSVQRRFGRSGALQRLRLARGERRLVFEVEVDWREEERFLKLAVPLDLQVRHSIAETQFGHIDRPTHENTSWEAARFELSGQRFVHLAEPGYGVALANDATYGYDITRQPLPGGGTTTTLRWSLLRGPRYPDPHADRGRHRFSFSLVAGAELADAVVEGYRQNLPLRRLRGARSAAPLVTFSNPAVVIEAVKLAEDRSGDVIVRCYESLGGRARTTCRCGFDLAVAERTDLLERPLARLEPGLDGTLALELRPFEILTLRLHPA